MLLVWLCLVTKWQATCGPVENGDRRSICLHEMTKSTHFAAHDGVPVTTVKTSDDQ